MRLVPVLALDEREGGGAPDGGKGGREDEVELASKTRGFMRREDAGAKRSFEFAKDELDT